MEEVAENTTEKKRPHIMNYGSLVLASMLFMSYDRLGIPSFGKGNETYGSRAVRNINPKEWKEQCKIKHQGRNELCACGSGKKCKKCCNNNLKINQEKISREDK